MDTGCILKVEAKKKKKVEVKGIADGLDVGCKREFSSTTPRFLT